MTDESRISDDLNELLLRDAGAGLENVVVTDRDRAMLILERLDCDYQLKAISGLLRRNKAADDLVEKKRSKIENYIATTSGSEREREVAEWGVNFYATIYQDAAHSMAALGMLAPFYESLFSHAFQGIRAIAGKDIFVRGHVRLGIVAEDDLWNCHLVYSPKSRTRTGKDLLCGIAELSDAIDLSAYLPVGLGPMLKALLAYRNRMFHCGFEWPKAECLAFAERIKQEGWEEWFSRAQRSSEPWIFYMTDDFIKRCLIMADHVLDAFGGYCRERRDKLCHS